MYPKCTILLIELVSPSAFLPQFFSNILFREIVSKIKVRKSGQVNLVHVFLSL